MTASNLSDLTNETFPVLIVGAGIVGAGLFRDLSLHGVPSLLIDKKDFSSQTSASSSKMLHGGIRYLENFDFPLVWEALHEKNLWLRLAPHLCYEESFAIPVYEESKHPLFMVKAGMLLYDLLSSFQNKPHQILSRQETLSRIPLLNPNGLKGSGVYHDAIMEDVKISLECIYDGQLLEGAQALNYTTFKSFKEVAGGYEAVLYDEIKDVEKVIKTKSIVFATGPFSDKVMGDALGDLWKPRILPSRGAHIWIDDDKIKMQHPMVINHKDGRVIFVIPERGAILVGTTEKLADGKFFDMQALPEEIDYLVSTLKEYFPDSGIQKTDVLRSFAGVRPLVKEDGTTDLGKTAREHKVFRPGKNLYAIMGGKYTTFRTMVQEVASELVQKENLSYSVQTTKRPFRQESTIKPFEPQSISNADIKKIISREMPKTIDDLFLRRIGFHGQFRWKEKIEESTLAQIKSLSGDQSEIEKYLNSLQLPSET